MTPEEFDIEFDFDKEYGYDADPDKAADDPDDFDLDAALARELGPDFDELFEKEYAAAQAALNAELAFERPAPEESVKDDSMEHTRFFRSFGRIADTEEEEEDVPAQETESPEEDSDEISEEAAEEISEEVSEEDSEDRSMEDPEEVPQLPRRERRPSRKSLDLGEVVNKVDWAAMGAALSTAGQVAAENGRNFVSALKECKPGKMDRKQKRRFKNDVLPFLIGGAALLMCLIFIIGAAGRSMNSEDRQAQALRESIAQAEAEAAVIAEIQNTLNTAARQAAAYDFQGAIDTLDSYKNTETGRELTAEMVAARADYSDALANLVIWDDPTAITNLSFHVLIEDAERAYKDAVYANSYRKKFVTTAEFSRILEQLYENGYVLVNLDSCITKNTDSVGNTTYTAKPIYLPEGKTPIMITETLVNYFEYMTDSNGDGSPDAGGAGFASRLVIDKGEIKAEYIDAGGQTLVGNYDLVPILDDFIDTHPGFSYRGAKAILAVTGDEGIFGWRTDRDESLVDGVKDIVEILRADGYQIACNSFANLDYGATSLSEISADLNKWTQKITPILGEVDILVIARGGSFDAAYNGTSDRFSMVYDAGFRYIIDSGDAVGGQLTPAYFYQNRLMVMDSEMGSGVYDAYFDLDTAEETA